MSIAEIYEIKCNDNSDICQHLPTLKQYAEKCETIVELGVRSIVSTWAFLYAKPKWLISVDIVHPSKYSDYDPDGCNLELVYKLAEENGISFKFVEADSRKIILPECDLMFFDTVHTRHQLTDELNNHSGRVKKYMAFHDTETYKKELMPVINQFVKNNKEWGVEQIWANNNGLLILKKHDNR